jgi:hypothetical protein
MRRCVGMVVSSSHLVLKGLQSLSGLSLEFWWYVVVQELLRDCKIDALVRLCGIENNLWFVVRVRAAAIDISNASRLHDFADRDALAGHGMKHLQNETLDRRRLDQAE